MFLTVHSAAGIVIGQSVVNPIGAFFIGLLSHLALDAIPHGDENFKDTTIKGMAKKAAADSAGVLANFFIIWQFFPAELFTFAVAAGVIGAMLPDWLMGVYRLTENSNAKILAAIHKTIKKFEDFHHYCHFRLIPYELPMLTGFALQALTLTALWLVLL